MIGVVHLFCGGKVIFGDNGIKGERVFHGSPLFLTGN